MSSRAPGGGTKRLNRNDFGTCAKFFSMPLSRVASGEADTIAGWLAYGAALNEGRAI